MYEAREQEDILQELQATSGTPASKIEGTFENDMLAANSLEFAKVEVELEQAYKAAFAETSWGDYLTMIAAQFGVDRKRAGKAKGIVTVTGTGSVASRQLRGRCLSRRRTSMPSAAQIFRSKPSSRALQGMWPRGR